MNIRKKNYEFAKVTIDNKIARITFAPADVDSEVLLSDGYLPVDPKPIIRPNYMVLPPFGVSVENGVVRVKHWRYKRIRDRKFSKLKLYAAAAKAGLWDRLVEWLSNQTVEGVNAKVAFDMANELAEDNPLFEQWLSKAQDALGLSTEVVDNILANSEV